MLTIPSVPRILCYGDSNTWGQHPSDGMRFKAQERWTAHLQNALGSSADIIEEGLSGRTTDCSYTNRPGRNGKIYLAPCLQSQNPLRIVILMLGTNDVKVEFNRSAADIAKAISSLITDIREYAKDEQTERPPHIILMSPVPVNPNAERFKTLNYQHYFNERSVEVSHGLTTELKKVASAADCAFFDAGQVAVTGEDGVHLDAASHKALGEGLVPLVKEFL